MTSISYHYPAVTAEEARAGFVEWLRDQQDRNSLLMTSSELRRDKNVYRAKMEAFGQAADYWARMIFKEPKS